MTKSEKLIPFTLPDISEREIKAVVGVLESGWLTSGRSSAEFEKRFAEAVGGQNAVAVNSCTAALHLALEAIGIRAGDEVIVPTMTFAATAEVVTYLGAIPVLVDCDPGTLNISLPAFEAALTLRTKAVIPVHFAGQSCRIIELCDLASAAKIKVVEDAAHAFPTTYRGRPVGSFGDITCFSFYATKTITTGEGGMAVTNNPQWAQRMKMMSLHGISRDAWSRYDVNGSWHYDIVEPGFKYNLTDIAAALGLVQLERAHEMLERRKEIAERYLTRFANQAGMKCLDLDPDSTHAWHLFVIRVDSQQLKISRNRVIELLRERGVGTSVHFIPLHLHSYYRERFSFRPEHFPNASAAFCETISLPIYSRMSDADVDYVADSLLSVLAENVN